MVKQRKYLRNSSYSYGRYPVLAQITFPVLTILSEKTETEAAVISSLLCLGVTAVNLSYKSLRLFIYTLTLVHEAITITILITIISPLFTS